MTDSLVRSLETVHPVYAEQAADWARFRAFGAHMKDNATWLPKGKQESDDAYVTRRSLTHNLGFSRAAVRRIVGVLTSTPADREHDAGEMPSNLVERLVAFDSDCDRTGMSIEDCGKDVLEAALTVGMSGTTVDKPQSDAADESEDPLPFLTHWQAEEVRDWDHDENGLLLWVKLRRDITVADSALDKRRHFHVWRVYDRESGAEWRQEFDPNTHGAEGGAVTQVSEWQHGLGVVPFAEMYARRRGVMRGESYIDELSLADWRKLQYDSDQAMASYIHGSPQLTIKTTADLDEVGVGTSHVLKLNPENGEDAEYLETDTSGMQVRENLIESAIRQGFNLAGIDPASVTMQSGSSTARSGSSLAWSFSTAEAPTLGAFSGEMERWDRRVHEIVTRYLVAGNLPPAFVEVYTGEIRRVRSWDLMSADRAVDLSLEAWDLVKSSTWRKATAADIALKVPGNIPESVQAAIKGELEEADYGDIASPFPPMVAEASDDEDGEDGSESVS